MGDQARANWEDAVERVKLVEQLSKAESKEISANFVQVKLAYWLPSSSHIPCDANFVWWFWCRSKLTDPRRTGKTGSEQGTKNQGIHTPDVVNYTSVVVN